MGLFHSKRRPTYYETRSESPDSAPRALAVEGIHEAVHKVVEKLPRGRLLDAGAGEGAFSQWADEKGFDVTALEIAPEYFRPKEIPCTGGDLLKPWPFPDNSFDVVAAIEVMEHMENHYHCIRECCRVVKPSGRIIISVPNSHNLQSRLAYFLTSFDDCAPRPIDELRPPTCPGHINPLTFPALEYGLRLHDFEVESVTVNRRRKLASALLPLAYPFMWLETYRQLILREPEPRLRTHNRRLMKTLLKPELLTGRVAIYSIRAMDLQVSHKAAA